MSTWTVKENEGRWLMRVWVFLITASYLSRLSAVSCGLGAASSQTRQWHPNLMFPAQKAFSHQPDWVACRHTSQTRRTAESEGMKIGECLKVSDIWHQLWLAGGWRALGMILYYVSWEELSALVQCWAPTQLRLGASLQAGSACKFSLFLYFIFFSVYTERAKNKEAGSARLC